MIKRLIAAAFVSLAACATGDAPDGATQAWRCDSGVSFTARTTTGGNVEVSAGGQTYRLPGVMAASGARYFDGRVEYWEHHGEAMLHGAAGGPYENCAQPEQGS